jgi:transposase
MRWRKQHAVQRVALRQAKAKPILDDLVLCLQSGLRKLSGKTPLANAIRYALTRIAAHKINRIDGLLPCDYKM